MDHHGWSLRVGAGVILCALLLRLTASGFFHPVAEFFAKPNIASFLIYLETGRIVRFSPSPEDTPVFARESPEPDFARQGTAPAASQPSTEPQPQRISFAARDAADIKFKNSAGVKFDAAALITQPLQWNLASEEPTVLILHTHGTESYTRTHGEDYKETSAFRTVDDGYNLISVGDRLAQLLETGGIKVLHDRKLHDYPSYNGSYSNARKEIKRYLKENPSIRLVLDLHRDASADNQNQMRTLASVDGEASAQIMFVVGTGSAAAKNPNWKDGLSLALKLQARMERHAAGVCRNINLRTQRFNQDLMPNMLLVEVGAAGNTRAEALTAVEVLAQAILELSHGTQ